MGVILAKFRKEKSTQDVLEALQAKIDTLETYTVNTQQQKKRIVGNFLALSIGIYIIAFVVYYFVYFPPTWRERFVCIIPLLLFPIIIILLRYVFTWYFQRKLDKNSKKLTTLRAEKKQILEQVMDKETYKVAVNLLARFGDKPAKTTAVALNTTPKKHTQPSINRSLGTTTLNTKSQQLALTPVDTPRQVMGYMKASTPRLNPQFGFPSPGVGLLAHNSGINQELRRRTPFPVVNQLEKGIFDRIVDVLIGDGPQDRFAMICKECHAHNGMALKEDFEYTTFRCAFCNSLNPARKARPVAPRLSVLPPTPTAAATADSEDSDTEEDKSDSDDEPLINLNAKAASRSPSSSHLDEEKSAARNQQSSDEPNDKSKEGTKNVNERSIDEEEVQADEAEDASLNELLNTLEKSDSAIEE